MLSEQSRRLRPARVTDAARVAVAALTASRSHLPSGIYDLFLQYRPDSLPEETEVLDFLARAVVAPHRCWGHWSDYRLVEQGDEVAGAVCSCPASALPDYPFPTDTLNAVASALGWPKERTAALRQRVERFLEAVSDLPFSTDDQTWFIQYLSVAPAFRGRGLGRDLLEHTLQEGWAAGATGAELFTDIGNSLAEGLYVRHGFVLVDEYVYHGFSAADLAVIGPGMRRWRLTQGSFPLGL